MWLTIRCGQQISAGADGADFQAEWHENGSQSRHHDSKVAGSRGAIGPDRRDQCLAPHHRPEPFDQHSHEMNLILGEPSARPSIMEAPIVSNERQRRLDARLEDPDSGIPVLAGDGQPNPILEDVRDMRRIGARLDEKQARMLDLGQLDP